MRLKTAVLLLLLNFYATVSSQELLPFVENFTKSEYNGDNQVWNVVQGSDNAMYFANHHYFLRYNGVKWEKYSLPNKTIIRSVFVDGDRVYSGSYKEFGYWKRIEGKMQYFSVSKNKNLFLGNADNEEIWKIFRHKDKLYFQSFNEIYVYNGKSVEKIKFPELISYCYVVNNKIYVAAVKSGIYTLEGNKIYKVKNWPQLENNIIHGMEKRNGQLYVFTKNNGIYTGNESSLSPWASSINNLIKGEVIVTAKFLNDTLLAVGTGLKGLYIINVKDNTYKNINRKNSIKNNAVLSLNLDKENDLWLGLDNGISHIEVNSPVNIFSDNSGILGSVYSLSVIQDNGYLFVTNHGIFTYKDKILNAIPDSQGQVWDIYKNGNEFIIGHNDGTFVYNGTGLKWVNPVNGGWKFLRSDFDNVYYQANYSGIAIYKDINDLTKWTILDSITKPVRNIAQNKQGELWAADNYRSLYRITYDKNFNVNRVENISRSNNITSDFGVKIFNFRNEILFLINNSWYIYNSILGKLEKDKIFNANFGNISDIIPVDDDRFLVLKDGLLYLITQYKGDFTWKLLPEKYYQGRLIMENTRVYKDGKQLLINLDDGFIAFDANRNKHMKQNISIEAYYMDALINDDTKIKYNQSVEINVIAEYFGYNRPDLLYRLNNAELQPVKNGNIILNNLSSGRQNLEIFINDGKSDVKVYEYDFYVARPWYFSFWMILVYIIVISGSFFLYYRWNKVRYMQKIRLHEEELKHRKQLLELEMEAENKLRQQEYDKHRLELEVQNKASEVAGKSLSIAKHSEMIEGIQEVLNNESNEGHLKTKIRQIIKTNTISKNEWQSFEKNLFKSHEEFVERLSKKYPSLTSKDIKLSIYLKMNLSSKEIAPLMNISYRGVELHRYRLRKKLNISQEENLSKFMINV